MCVWEPQGGKQSEQLFQIQPSFGKFSMVAVLKKDLLQEVRINCYSFCQNSTLFSNYQLSSVIEGFSSECQQFHKRVDNKNDP